MSKRVRAEAVRVCLIAASSDPSYDSDPSGETIAQAANLSYEAGQLADDAAAGVGLEVWTKNYSLRECYAEAAQRLQEGWLP